MHCFTAFDACGACATLHVSTLIATPGLGVVDTQLLAMRSYGTLRDVGVGSFDRDMVARPFVDCAMHGLDERGSTVRIDGMVTEVISDVDPIKAP